MERLELTTIAKIKMLANEGIPIKEIADIVGKPYAAVRYHARQAENYSGPSHDKTIASHDRRMRAIIENTEKEALTRKTLAHELGINPTALSVWLRETKDPIVEEFKTASKKGIWRAVTFGVLHYGDGYSYERISHIKHVSVSTVQNQINKIKELHLEPLVIARITIGEPLWTFARNAANHYEASERTPEDSAKFAESVARIITNPKWNATKRLYAKNKDLKVCFESIETFGHGNWDELISSIKTAEYLVKTAEPKLKTQ